MKYKIPPLHNISAYKKAVMAFPNLEEGKEHTQEELVMSHLKLVVSIAAKYSYSDYYEDLIQIGNMALIRAAETFDQSMGYNFSSYATPRITYDMQNAQVELSQQVKLFTTKPLKKAYNNMPKYRAGNKSLTMEQVKKMATELNIKEEEVLEAEQRLHGVSYSPLVESDEEGNEYEIGLSDETHSPLHVLESLEYEDYLTNTLPNTLKILNDRERDIVFQRYLAEEPKTLAELGVHYGVSTERIRQLEVGALKKMRKSLVKY